MITLGGRARDAEAGRIVAADCLDSGHAARRFRNMVAAQGGDARCVDQPDRLPEAPAQRDLLAEEDGWVTRLAAREVGLISMALGAGRERPGAAIQPGVGIVLHRKVGDPVRWGDSLATLHAGTEAAAARAAERLTRAYRIDPEPPAAEPLIIDVIGGANV
jgi:pyrimidine-nucleoside phosphorylase